MRVRSLIAVALVVLTGCARATLPYKPESQPPGARVSADYQIIGDRVRIEIDTGGLPLEQVWMMKPDGTSLGPQSVETPRIVAGARPSFSFGLAGAASGSHSNVATGASVGIPFGEGSGRAAGNTIAWFPLGPAGPPPWQLYVKLAGTVPTTFPVGGPPPA